MSGYVALTKKEIKAHFTSSTMYVFLAMFTLICGYFFYRNYIYFSLLSLQSDYGSGGATLNISEAVFQPVYSNFVFVFIVVIPLITMRVFSEEKKLGTLELLLSYPVRYIDVVLAKLTSAFVVVVFALLLTAVFPVIAAYYGVVETAPVLTSYLGLSLIGLSFVTVGTFFSSVTENQIVAAALTFGVLLLLWALEWTASLVPGGFGEVMSELSVYNRFRDLNRGVLNSSDIVFFLNISVFFGVLTVSNLQRQAWKS